MGDHLNIRIYQYIFPSFHDKLGDIIEIWQTETQKDSNFDFFRIGVGKRKSKKDKI